MTWTKAATEIKENYPIQWVWVCWRQTNRTYWWVGLGEKEEKWGGRDSSWCGKWRRGHNYCLNYYSSPIVGTGQEWRRRGEISVVGGGRGRHVWNLFWRYTKNSCVVQSSTYTDSKFSDPDALIWLPAAQCTQLCCKTIPVTLTAPSLLFHGRRGRWVSMAKVA